MKLSVILPTLNERESICRVIDLVTKNVIKLVPEYEIIVVDDNSEDGTVELVRDHYGTDDHVRVHVRTEEPGLAASLKTGIELSKGDLVLLMDSDFNHSPDRIPEMVHTLRTADVVVGSRYIKGGGMEKVFWRFCGSYLFNKMIKVVLGLRTNDNLSGFVLFRRDILSRMDIECIFQGYGDYFIHFLQRAHQLKLRIIEIPVYYAIRNAGFSKTRFLHHLVQYSRRVLAIYRVR